MGENGTEAKSTGESYLMRMNEFRESSIDLLYSRIGENVGKNVGASVGLSVGMSVGLSVGASVGMSVVGKSDGAKVGCKKGVGSRLRRNKVDCKRVELS